MNRSQRNIAAMLRAAGRKVTVIQEPRQEILRIAKEHLEADRRMGREWECACGACNTVRQRFSEGN